MPTSCPKCRSTDTVRNGRVEHRQRHLCRECGYTFTVAKLGKAIDPYYVVKALQLYVEGVPYREIERLLGVSHVSVMNWVEKYNVQLPAEPDYKPTYRVLTHLELAAFVANRDNLRSAGMIITELGDKYMVIRWERFRPTELLTQET